MARTTKSRVTPRSAAARRARLETSLLKSIFAHPDPEAVFRGIVRLDEAGRLSASGVRALARKGR